VFVAPVVAGNTYTLGLAENSDYGGSGLGTTGTVDAAFSWTLPGASSSSVPDGGTTIALLGMGVVGLAMLRRSCSRIHGLIQGAAFKPDANLVQDRNSQLFAGISDSHEILRKFLTISDGHLAPK
jgi:VPDSG-CTERM motif